MDQAGLLVTGQPPPVAAAPVLADSDVLSTASDAPIISESEDSASESESSASSSSSSSSNEDDDDDSSNSSSSQSWHKADD